MSEEAEPVPVPAPEESVVSDAPVIETPTSAPQTELETTERAASDEPKVDETLNVPQVDESHNLEGPESTSSVSSIPPTAPETTDVQAKEPTPAVSEVSDEDKLDIDGDVSIQDASKDDDYQANDDGEEDEDDDDDDEDDEEQKKKSELRKSDEPKVKLEKTEEPKPKQDDESLDTTVNKRDEDVDGDEKMNGADQISEEKDEDVEKDDDEPYIPQTHTIVIPSYAAWFDFKKIHAIEKESLPEFFTNRNPSKTPQLYVKYRNFLINAYRLNPNDYLTVTAARRSLVGDVNTIMRLHRFLSRWGLINYQVDAEVKPKPVEPPFTGDYDVSYDAPRGLFPYESFKPPMEPQSVEKLKEILGVKRGISEVSGGASESNGESATKTEEGEKVVNGKKPRIVDTINDGWSKEDLKKLLEGLSKYKGDWEQVAKHVGTHTVEQCIVRFLKLPIEDQYLGDSKANLGPLKYAPYLPFSQADNPVLSTIAFLVSLVDPDVVRAATERAIKIVDEKDLEAAAAKEAEKKDEEGKDDDEPIKEGATVALATVGARAHVFKTNEEIEMNKLTNDVVNAQLNKFELKMNRLEIIEKELDLEKRVLQKQQEDLFLDRLSFSKTSSEVLGKLTAAVEAGDAGDSDTLKKLIEGAKELLAKPTRSNVSGFDFGKREASVGDTTADDAQSTADDTKPISIETPQTYRYWSG